LIRFLGENEYTVAYLDDEYAGFIRVQRNEIIEVSVLPQHRRKGIATALYNHVGRPNHSLFRTDEGNAWAHAVGGFIPNE